MGAQGEGLESTLLENEDPDHAVIIDAVAESRKISLLTVRAGTVLLIAPEQLLLTVNSLKLARDS